MQTTAATTREITNFDERRGTSKTSKATGSGDTVPIASLSESREVSAMRDSEPCCTRAEGVAKSSCPSRSSAEGDKSSCPSRSSGASRSYCKMSGDQEYKRNTLLRSTLLRRSAIRDCSGQFCRSNAVANPKNYQVEKVAERKHLNKDA
jgi:hypothetical protein